MTFDDFATAFADSFDGLSRSELNPEIALASIPEWDSLAVLVTIAMVDSEFDVSLDPSALRDCKTLGDIFQIVNTASDQ